MLENIKKIKLKTRRNKSQFEIKAFLMALSSLTFVMQWSQHALRDIHGKKF